MTKTVKRTIIILAMLLLAAIILYVPQMKLCEYSSGEAETLFQSAADETNGSSEVYLISHMQTTLHILLVQRDYNRGKLHRALRDMLRRFGHVLLDSELAVQAQL